MGQDESGHGDRIGPLDWLRLRVDGAVAASSERLGWVGIEAVRYRDALDTEGEAPPSPYHRLVLINRPPVECEVHYEEVDRHVPVPAGTVAVIPEGSPLRWRCHGPRDALHVFLESELVARVVAESFGLDRDRLVVPPFERLDLPQLRAAMQAVDAELTAGDAGGPLAAESLANVLAIHLIRHVAAPRRPGRGRDGTLPRARLRAVVEYIEGHLDVGPTLAEMADVARLSPYHFARQFRAATGLPPHQFVLARRVDRAKQLLHGRGDLPLAQVAARSGFSDQSQFSRHFKRLVGVSPGQFRMSARIA
jgi:AraC family transcriptional regulator